MSVEKVSFRKAIISDITKTDILPLQNGATADPSGRAV
jgi:hypothetical protein